MKHILYVLPYLEKAGTERQALSLIKHFQQSQQATLLAPDDTGTELFAAAGVKHYKFDRLERNLWQGLTKFRRHIKQIHQEKPIDLVHVHAAHELMLLVRLFLPGVPIVFTVHGYHGDQAQVSYWLASKFINLFADRAIAVCKADLENLLQLKTNPHKLSLIHNGVAEPKVDPIAAQALATQYGLDPEQHLIIGTAARLNPAKGLEFLIAAFAQLAQEHDQLRLAIAGEGYLEAELKQMAIDLGVGDRVVFTGFVDNLADLVSLFDVFALPSLQEAFSLAFLEAMALQKPIVGTKVGGIPEQVIDGHNGFVVVAGDAAAVAEKLAILINDPLLRKEFSHNSYQRYQTNFTTEIMIAKTDRVYADLLGNPVR
ncbi:glycosyl transferase group 1 [Thalassoporum mexicanum PCC 7367]|uniref:glycosyltransferase family 4 protein n=1 Tax=Thalassoporum mexicanum TaxID=3457544 RepID=UPI00029FA227|nr:glycosyltransferase family 4 protein [Pseudanabaena sp. PCC 7367]AFY70958.1 glycosyl transferase group 1 [Pseudanabaena sp. PCC 7367]